jgi:hypothetical protein
MSSVPSSRLTLEIPEFDTDGIVFLLVLQDFRFHLVHSLGILFTLSHEFVILHG